MRIRPLPAAFGLTVALGLSGAGLANPYDLMGRRAKPFIEPEGFYRVVLPTGFDCKAEHRHLECNGKRGRQASFTIDVRQVPRSATVQLIFLNQMERFQKKPHFRKVRTQSVLVDGTDAIMATFTYDYLGNVQIPVGVQALYLVRENKLFVLHFEARREAFDDYQKDMRTVWETFKPAMLDPGGNPILEDLRIEPNKRRNVRTDQDIVEQLKEGKLKWGF